MPRDFILTTALDKNNNDKCSGSESFRDESSKQEKHIAIMLVTLADVGEGYLLSPNKLKLAKKKSKVIWDIDLMRESTNDEGTRDDNKSTESKKCRHLWGNCEMLHWWALTDG
ncbi:11867_t:CDS:2 [Funneliformis caledonium]|uniref:11867_t:CDS:1 n=1 Tax=Funneliformis caledonium TaxID=1117310 RepID=A0A9N9D8U2_9GLOM|nr:11867_t:CDS:2 [Funneliformis caledonium]